MTLAPVWIRCSDGELVRSDVITWLRCRGGEVEAACLGGAVVRLAGPGCPADFHVGLLRELEVHGRQQDDRWMVIVTAEITPRGARWVSARLDEFAKASQGSQSPAICRNQPTRLLIGPGSS